MRWEDDEVRMTSLETREDTRALKTRSVHGGGYVPHFLVLFFQGSVHSGRSKVTRVTVGRDTKVFEFVKLILRP